MGTLGFLIITGILCHFVGGQSSNQYTQQERDAINNFRPLVSQYLVQDFQRKDAYLLRFLRAYNLDLKQAAQELEKVHKWRKENNMETILDEKLGGHQKYLPYKVDGFDRHGRPVIQLYFGKWQLRKYVLAGKRDDAVKQFRQMLEKGLQKIFQTADSTGRDIDQFYLLADLDGYSTRDSLCLGCVPLTLDFATSVDSGYGVFAGNITNLNTPRIFLPVLPLVKQVFRSHALKAYNSYDNDKEAWKKIINNDIAPDQLPSSLGGTL